MLRSASSRREVCEDEATMDEEDVPRRANTPTEPRGDRAAAGTDLQAAPARANPERLEMTDRAGIQPIFECGEALACTLPCVVKCVAHQRSSSSDRSVVFLCGRTNLRLI